MVIAAEINCAIVDGWRRRHWSAGLELPFHLTARWVQSVDDAAGAGDIDDTIDQLGHAILKLPGEGILPDLISRTAIQCKKPVVIGTKKDRTARHHDHGIFYLTAILRGNRKYYRGRQVQSYAAKRGDRFSLKAEFGCKHGQIGKKGVPETRMVSPVVTVTRMSEALKEVPSPRFTGETVQCFDRRERYRVIVFFAGEKEYGGAYTKAYAKEQRLFHG